MKTSNEEREIITIEQINRQLSYQQSQGRIQNMKTIHPIYQTEKQAETARREQKRLNRTVSLPWQDDKGYWRITILH